MNKVLLAPKAAPPAAPAAIEALMAVDEPAATREKLGPLKGYNNIGIQDKPLSIFYEGEALSKVLNIVPAGINAVAGLHDKFQTSMTGWMRNVFNVPGMIPAAVITYGGMTDLECQYCYILLMVPVFCL
jgi:hypothetical protein